MADQYGNDCLMTSDIAIEFSELFEAVGIGSRFATVLDRVRNAANQTGDDRVRNLLEMMKTALHTYIKQTNDVLTAREIFSRAIHSGADMMLTVTAAVILANALTAQYPQQAAQLVKMVAGKMSGAQNSSKGIADSVDSTLSTNAETPAVSENASASATGTGAIATTVASKKKKRKNSMFAETLSWNDIQDSPMPTVLESLQQIRETGRSQNIEGVLVDPTTSELVMAAHHSLNPVNQHKFGQKSITEMVRIANRLIESGLLQIEMIEE